MISSEKYLVTNGTLFCRDEWMRSWFALHLYIYRCVPPYFRTQKQKPLWCQSEMAKQEGDKSAGVESFKILLRDINPNMVKSWEDKKCFGDAIFKDSVSVSSLVMYICCVCQNILCGPEFKSYKKTSLKSSWNYHIGLQFAALILYNTCT